MSNRNLLIFMGVCFAVAVLIPSGGGVSPFGPTTQKVSAMVVIEPENKPGLPASMTSSWQSADVANWMKENADEPLQIVDKERVAEMSGKFADVIKEYPPERYPWLYITNGAHGAAGDPPIDRAELMKWLKEYGPK